MSTTNTKAAPAIAIDEDHPVIAAILRVRLRNAGNFAPSHSGALGEARDDTLLEIYREVKAVLEGRVSDEQPKAEGESPARQGDAQ